MLDEGGEIPPALQNMPDFPYGGEGPYEAFWILSNGRTRSMSGSNPIAFSEIVAYFDYKHISDMGEREEYILIIRRLDSLWLKYEGERIERDRRRKSNTGDRRTAR